MGVEAPVLDRDGRLRHPGADPRRAGSPAGCARRGSSRAASRRPRRRTCSGRSAPRATPTGRTTTRRRRRRRRPTTATTASRPARTSRSTSSGRRRFRRRRRRRRRARVAAHAVVAGAARSCCDGSHRPLSSAAARPVPLTPPGRPGLESRRAGRQAQRRARAPAVPLEPRSRSGLLAVVAVARVRRRPQRPAWRMGQRAAPRSRRGRRRLGPVGQRLVPPDRRERLLLAVEHAGVLPALPASRRGRSAAVLAGHAVLAGVLVSLAAGAAAFALLYRLTSDSARRGGRAAHGALPRRRARPRSSSERSTANRSSCSSPWPRSSRPSAGGSGRPGRWQGSRC